MGLLGQDSITITDITDVNPIRLDLTSSQPIYQTKRISGNYEPDYENDSLIITPFLYFGVEEVNREKYKDKISFYLNGHIVENTENIYIQDTKLYIKQNLIENTKIEAVITNITDDKTKVTYETISESLSFYLLSYESSGYTAFIDSAGGRYDFSSTNSDKIILRAHLYLGATELDAVSYEWKRSSGLSITNNKEKSLDITRDNIYSHENFICEMGYEGVTFTASCAIDDRTDEYKGVIISSGSLIMSPAFDTATFTCQILKNGNIIEANESFDYSWRLYANNDEEVIELSEEKSESISLTLGIGKVPRNSFTLYCTTKIDGKYTVVSYLPIAYKNSGYTAYIQSENGRYDFSSENDSNIKLTAYLYDGTTKLTPSYEWKRSSRLPIDDSKKNQSFLEIGRTDIHSHENFICEMTYEGVTYTAVCPIDDRTDEYTGVIVSDKSLVMSPISNKAKFTCKIFKNGIEANKDGAKENFSYSWTLYSNGRTDGIEIEVNQKQIDLTIDGGNIPKDSFTLYCTTIIDGKNIVVSYLPITYKNGGYTAFINSGDGRYDFSSDKSEPITLTAHLYDGTTELTPEYLWKRSSGLDITNNEGKSLYITRSDIYSHENFICEMKYEGITYTATCAIDDRTDLYTSAIISDTSLVMTPSFKTSTFTCKIFKNQGEVTGSAIEYSWIYYENGSTDGKTIGTTKDITITLGDENMPKNSFTLYCTATIDGKFITVAYLPVSYSVSYTPILTPKTIFIPANSDGSYKGEGDTIETTLTFFLQGDDGKPIDAELSNFSINGANCTPTKVNNKYSIPFSLTVDDFNSLETSSMFELSYTYKEKDFNEEFYIVKNVQGHTGEDGASYSLILSNDYHRFSGKEIYAIEGQDVSTIVSFYKGDEVVKIENIKIGSKILTTTPQELDTGGLTAKITDAASNTKEIVFTTLRNKLSVGGVIEIQAIVNINEQEHNFVTMFTYDINYEGNSYFLSFTNGTSISYLPSKNTFTPNKLEFYAYYRQNGSGENKLYTDGRVYVSIDGSKEKEYLSPKIDGGAYYEYTKVSNIKNSITFYLYNSLTKTEGLKDEYLMDRETIPILTSLEGAEIGGDNLLKFSRTFEAAENRWTYKYGFSDEIAITKNNEFNVLNFNFAYKGITSSDSPNNGSCYVISPPFFIDEEVINKDLCFSVYFKINSSISEVKKSGNKIYFSLLGYSSPGSLIKESDPFSFLDIRIEDDNILENGKWIRLYEVFKGNILQSSNIKYFRIKICGLIDENNTSTHYNFYIKKPKLEIGNTPTAWCMASNDIILEGLNLDSANLGSGSIVDILKQHIASINSNSNNINSLINGAINVSINNPDGTTSTFTKLEDLSKYLNESLNRVVELQKGNNEVINNRYDTLALSLDKLYKFENKIEMGYDNNNLGKPYLLFDAAGGLSGKKESYQMKLTTERLSFLYNNNELAYFGNKSMTISKARVNQGIYLGTPSSGYLLIKTTEQGCAFIWEGSFDE